MSARDPWPFDFDREAYPRFVPPQETVPARPTLKEEAQRLLDYWEAHGENLEAVSKWAISDLLGICRYIAEGDEQ
jgi:hypothetical protein